MPVLKKKLYALFKWPIFAQLNPYTHNSHQFHTHIHSIIQSQNTSYGITQINFEFLISHPPQKIDDLYVPNH